MKLFRFYLVLLVWVCVPYEELSAQQQDSITLTFAQAKERLLKENLQLLAAHFEISAADAQLIQAKLWNNPNFIWNQDLYSNEQNRYFNYRNQRLIQVEQTFSIAGKHTNTVKLSKLGVELSRYQFQDVFRSLIYELGNVYYSLNAAQQQQELYSETLKRYQQLLTSADQKLKIGAIASNEVLRLRSEQIAIQAEASSNLNEVLGLMSELRILLNIPSEVRIQTVDETPAEPSISGVEALIDSAMMIRPDLKLQEAQIRYENQNLRLQRSLIFPDLTFGYQPHDKGSNYVRPYQGLTLEFNMPIYNRNQGNIKLAKTRISQAELNMRQVENRLQNQVRNAFDIVQNTRTGFQNFSEEFLKQTENLNENANLNYGKKNINLLEYIDLQRIYIQNKVQYIQLKNAYLRSLNELDFVVGKSLK